MAPNETTRPPRRNRIAPSKTPAKTVPRSRVPLSSREPLRALRIFSNTPTQPGDPERKKRIADVDHLAAVYQLRKARPQLDAALKGAAVAYWKHRSHHDLTEMGTGPTRDAKHLRALARDLVQALRNPQ